MTSPKKPTRNASRLVGLCVFCFWVALMNACAVTPDKRFVPPDSLTVPELHWQLPKAERIVLDNGMTLFFLANTELPLVKLSAMIQTGFLHDPEGKEGLADLTAYLLRTGGTVRHQSDRVDQMLDDLAVPVSFGMSMDSGSAQVSFLKSDLDASMTIFADMLRHPAFEPDKTKLALALKLEDLRRVTDNPQRLAFREFNRLLYPDDPRGRLATSPSLLSITREDLVAFHKRFYYPANMMVAITGDITKEEAVLMMNAYFGDWPNVGPSANPPPAPQASGSGLFLIHRPLTQSTVVAGELTVSRKDPDFYAFELLDFIIGSGGFPSRIFSAVRNNEGLAYSAGSFFRARGNYGVFGTYAITKTESTIEAADLINTILREVAEGKITQEELNWAKTSTLNAFIFSFERPDQIVSQQMSLFYEQMPDDHLATYRKRIEAVSLNDLKRVSATYLRDRKRLTLILGDTEKLGEIPAYLGKPIQIIPAE